VKPSIKNTISSANTLSKSHIADMKLGQCGRGGDSKLATVSVDRKLLVEPLEFTTDIRHLTSFDDLGA